MIMDATKSPFCCLEAWSQPDGPPRLTVPLDKAEDPKQSGPGFFMKHILLSSSLALALTGLLLTHPARLQAQDTSGPASNKEPSPTAQEVSPELMRSFLYLQEQVHSTQMAVERSRLEAETAATRNTEALSTRLDVIEKALDQARKQSDDVAREASAQVRDSNRQVMIFAGVFATLGFLALALTGWMLWRTMSRLAQVSSPLGFPALLSSPGYEALGFGAATGQKSSPRLMDALGRLEHRIADLESGHYQAPLPMTTPPVKTTNESAGDPSDVELASLIREGEELLAHEEAEKAIAHFDAVLAKHPGHPEVLLRKGEALERLKRDQEAIDCYDLAIRADKTLTMAYLHKGGLYNRMERFNDAMECYEQALKVQEGRAEIS